MKFTLGFFVGLMTGIMLILGPLTAVLVALAYMAQKDENTRTDNDVEGKSEYRKGVPS